MSTLKDVLEMIRELSQKDREVLQRIITNEISSEENLEQFITEDRFSGGRVCPHCGGTHIVRNGHRKDRKQRYICRECKVSFVINANSITKGTRKPLEVWQTYIGCMMNCDSVRKSAEICEITTKTAFIWRHKILDALQNMADGVVMEGIVEADETFFPVSYKGNHKHSKIFAMPRPAHKRGKDHEYEIAVIDGIRTKVKIDNKRGISKNKVCVPCAINRCGLSIAKIATLGKIRKVCLHKLYDGRITEGTTLCTDKEKAYRQFSKENSLNLIQLESGKSVKGLYNIQHINNYHSQLKKFIDKFNGVSSKYLNNYLIWNNLLNYSTETFREKEQIFLKFVLCTLKTINGNELADRPAVPVLA